MFQIIKIAHPIISEEEKSAVLEVLSSGYFVQGENVEKFENEFAKYIGCKFAIAVSSGTAALHLSLLSLGITNTHDVVVPSFSFISTANCALYCGAKPIFTDISPDTFNINPTSVKSSITRNTKAIIPVHLFGQSAAMDEINELATKNSLYVVEDCAQALGTEFLGKKVGTFGGLGCFSFYPTKLITTLEGGMITTNNEELADKLRVLRNIGQKSRYTHVELGYNYRMNEVEAAIGIFQLKNLDKWIGQRIKNASFLSKNLQGMRGIITPFVDTRGTHIFNSYTIRVTEEFPLSRDELVSHLIKNGIESIVYYPIPIHKQPIYEKFGYGQISLPETDKVSKSVLSLPVHPLLTNGELQKIVSTIQSAGK